MTYFELFCTCVICATGVTVGALVSMFVILKLLDWYFAFKENK